MDRDALRLGLPGSRRFLYRYAQFMVAAVTFLLVAGALVTSTDSGLAVPDWPLSFGQVMPPMEGGVFYEHGHRMVATAIGFLTIILAVWLWLREPRSWMRRLGWIALGMVVTQGLFGGLTVLLKLPVWSSAIHACLGQSFFLVIVFIALALSPGWNQEGIVERRAAGLPLWATVTTGAIFFQLVLGAVMRHMNAALVVPDFPTVFGGFWPPTWTPAIAVHLAHRAWAVVVVALVTFTAIRALRAELPRLRRPAGLMLVLVFVQFLLGASIIWTGRSVHVSATHVVVGAVLLATSFVLTARARRRVVRSSYAHAPSLTFGDITA